MHKKSEINIRELVAQGLPMRRREGEPPLAKKMEVEKENETAMEVTANDVPAHEVLKPIERTKRKTASKEDYESLFLTKCELKNRKSVYLSQTTHERVTLILNTVTKGELSIGGFLENIVLHHLENYKEEITTLFDSRFKRPY